MSRIGRRLRVAAAGAIAIGLIASIAAPRPAFAFGPLPACRYDDILTAPREYSAWPDILVDTILMVPKGYVPPDLVSVKQAGIPGTALVRKVVIDDLRAMTAAAKAAGAMLAVQSAYRSYAMQRETFAYWEGILGHDEALTQSARPGHSEHQLGLAVDFKTNGGPDPWDPVDWATTTEGAWVAAHGWEFGWVISYPPDSISTSCYTYEPWHLRYVGRANATLIHDSGLVPRAWFWMHVTRVTVDPLASPSTGPSPTLSSTSPPSPSPSPSAEPTAEPSPSAAPGGADGSDGDRSRTLMGLVAIGLVGVGTWVLATALGARRRARSDGRTRSDDRPRPGDRPPPRRRIPPGR